MVCAGTEVPAPHMRVPAPHARVPGPHSKCPPRSRMWSRHFSAGVTSCASCLVHCVSPPLWPTEAAQRALRVALFRPEAAASHHPDVADGEVEPDGIDGIDSTQCCRDIGGHAPPCGAVACQAQA